MDDVISTDLRYVAYFDMLGMSQLTVRDPDLAWQALSGLSNAQQEILRLEIELTSTAERIQDRVRAFTFSDSIVMFSLSDEPSDTWAIVVLAAELFARALHYSIPIRGAISHGRFLFNFECNLFSGPPLVSAYRLAEEAQWLGVRVDEVVAARVQAVPITSPSGAPVVISWAVPVKSGGTVISHVLDWVCTHRANFTVATPISVEAFYQAFVRLFGQLEQLPGDVRAKYENTVQFVNERLQGTLKCHAGGTPMPLSDDSFLRWYSDEITRYRNFEWRTAGYSMAFSYVTILVAKTPATASSVPSERVLAGFVALFVLGLLFVEFHTHRRLNEFRARRRLLLAGSPHSQAQGRVFGEGLVDAVYFFGYLFFPALVGFLALRALW